MMDPEHYYREFALAYIRGRLNAEPMQAQIDTASASAALNTPSTATNADEARLLAIAHTRGWRLHRFKRTAGLPRVRKVIGVLKGFAPQTLLDIGTGRGAFLWPLLDQMPALQVTAIDALQHRVDDINAMRRGGIERVTAQLQQAESLPWAAASFDAVTILEVLEHVADPAPVAAEVVRVAGRIAIATVPAKEDDNPEHIRLFTRDSLKDLFMHAGASEVRIEHVLNHLVAVVKP